MALARTFFLLSSFTILALASNCITGLDYCGYNLLGIGNYQAQISDALQKASLDPTNKGIATNTLFHCVGGYNGNIVVIKFCANTCADGGPGKSDFCDEASSSTASTPTSSRTTSTTSSTATQSTTASSADSSGASATSTNPTSSTDTKSSGNTPVGAIAGGVVGGAAGLALIGLGLFLFFKRSRQRHKSLDQSMPELKPIQEQSSKGYTDAHPIPQDGSILEAPGDVARERYELSGAPVNTTETRYELL
ncbi:uncharacterized protein TrAFT101_000136 [Trichoderma asperellum]|uniref:Epidermal growth factor receptor-like transmembrane-juxtamembrane segment domain-containing protein n=1 Tax=Trichoderma asperellum (strain ATCC 204424 / CBS 433.97 / NBRC 101777) TaxID=1042311 RepID=A0A2T3YUF4_TRIA4|nr:hypothetical protein M441DRAFT_177898 [Trichoderma asperellum CBS 433.97]PTB36169.1 hypothetical protein M441DRAFT_177898 [Trichoderma asperellum CBS 433.97]UKZ84221.1 hypothetical protein TrAFT101_000136 [Trichoderma asperellum]